MLMERSEQISICQDKDDSMTTAALRDIEKDKIEIRLNQSLGLIKIFSW